MIEDTKRANARHNAEVARRFYLEDAAAHPELSPILVVKRYTLARLHELGHNDKGRAGYAHLWGRTIDYNAGTVMNWIRGAGNNPSYDEGFENLIPARKPKSSPILPVNFVDINEHIREMRKEMAEINRKLDQLLGGSNGVHS